jgi:parvulin-like peptidyl-prolyl isomerase
MIRYLRFSLVVGVLNLVGGTLAFAERTFVDGMVAKVDNAPILHSQVDEKVKKGPLIRVSPYPAAETADSYERALQDEVNFRIVMRKAKELNIEVEESKVDEQMERIMKPKDAPPLTLPQFEQLLIREGKTLKAFRQDLRDQYLLMHFRARVIMPLVKVTQRDVENHYLKKAGTPAESVKFHLQHIAFSAVAGSSEYAKQQERAQAFCAQLAAGKSLKEAEGALEAGHATPSSPWVVQAKDLAPQIRGEIEPLSEGQASKPIAAADGVHVFFVERKEFAGSDEFAAQKEQLEYELRQEELGVQLQRWLEQERAKSKITILSRQ